MNKKNNIRKTRQEKKEENKKLIESKQHGEGLFLFKNRSDIASLDLPKKSFDGKKWIGPSETWKGDSYFFKMIPREAVLIKTLIDPNQKPNDSKEEETTMLNEESKLLLDQPDQVTEGGKIEHIIPDVKNSINEDKSKEDQIESKNTLLTEDPLSGVTIICD